MNTITVANVREAAQNLFRTLKAVGLVPKEAFMYVHPGDKRNGISWGLTYWGPGDRTGDHTKFPAVDLHGAYTRKDAWTRITAANTALQAVLADPGPVGVALGDRLVDRVRDKYRRGPGLARGYVQCPHAECGYVGTEAQVDDHRTSGVHDNQPQAGANIRR